ncbi:MAG: hypothetical protein P8186_29810 [Anaerolineae bacterium]
MKRHVSTYPYTTGDTTWSDALRYNRLLLLLLGLLLALAVAVTALPAERPTVPTSPPTSTTIEAGRLP